MVGGVLRDRAIFNGGMGWHFFFHRFNHGADTFFAVSDHGADILFHYIETKEKIYRKMQLQLFCHWNSSNWNAAAHTEEYLKSEYIVFSHRA